MTTRRSVTPRPCTSASTRRSRSVGLPLFCSRPTARVTNSFTSGSTTRPISSNFRSDAMELEAIERIADRYRDEGYDVIVHPRADQVPPFAAGFELDLLATRGNE